VSDGTATPSVVEAWFGAAFAELHPQLQALHRDGGVLAGPVMFETGRGLGGLLGRFALRRLGIDPAAGPQALTVRIGHDAQGLRWARRFNDGRELVSLFKPHGHWPSGYWIERAGPLELKLDVDFVDGGWRWRPLRYRLFGVPLSSWLLPSVEAGKRIVGDAYRFDIRIAFLGIGTVLAYGGDLRLQSRPGGVVSA
jgi:Domain of unknown function (DUF4166)